MEAEVMERGGGGQGKERDQSLGMIAFDATTNRYDNGKDNALVRTMMATTTKIPTISTTTARTTAEVEEGEDEERGGDGNGGKRW